MKTRYYYFAASLALGCLTSTNTYAQPPAYKDIAACRVAYSSGEAIGVIDLPGEVKRWHNDEFDQLPAARQDFYCAVAGDTKAAHHIARRYYQGFDTPPVTRDITADKKAAAYFEFAADRGDTKAMAVLSHLYYVGDGVKKDIFQSYYWAYLAHKLGNRHLRTAFQMIERNIPAHKRFAIRKKAEQWKPATTELKTVLSKYLD